MKISKKMVGVIFSIVVIALIGFNYNAIISSFVQKKVETSKEDLLKEKQEISEIMQHYADEVAKAREEIKGIDDQNTITKLVKIQMYKAYFAKTKKILKECERKILRIEQIETMLQDMEVNMGNAEEIIAKIEKVKPVNVNAIILNNEDLQPMAEIKKQELIKQEEKKGEITD